VPGLSRRSTVPESEKGDRRFRSLGDLTLLALSLPIAWKAQKVYSRPLEIVATELSRGRWLPGTNDVGRARCAAARACRFLSRLTGARHTCLTRSLVTGALLAGRPGVELHIGFKAPGGDAVVDGHAWVTVDGHSASGGSVSEVQEASYGKVVSIPMRRPARG
jgi:hypothetical protein